MNQNINLFKDEYENQHLKDKLIGQGGQGVVFRTKDPDLAIKLVTDETGNPITDKESIKKYSNRFKRVRLLPIPDDINISLPVALIENNAGYVMQLLSEMVPFSNFWPDGKSLVKISDADIPSWLSNVPENEAKKIIHYCKTGGLKRRLKALYKCASQLARLHGNGLVYGDISPNNIFISEGLDDSSVWLIDADNIRFEVAVGGSVVYTPKYGAPELVDGKDVGRPSSDCHAFAVVAFFLLSMIHPFVGKKVDGTDDGDWADEENDGEDVEDKAYAGLFPWVDDQDDDSNSSDSGLPRLLLLTDKLTKLFESTFGRGRTASFLRPTIYHWPEALAQAADTTITCPNCSMSYYFDYGDDQLENECCPYCEENKPAMLILETYRWNGVDLPLEQPSWRFIHEINSNSEIIIPKRVFKDFEMLTSDIPEISIQLNQEGLLIKKLDHSDISFSIAIESSYQGSFQQLYSQIMLVVDMPSPLFWIYVDCNSPKLIKCMIKRSKE